jgi:hypothetical protein
MAIISNRVPTTSGDSRDESEAATPSAPSTDANRIENHTLTASNSANARHTLIAEAAYRMAQQRGFSAGEDWQDWFAAEREVDALLDPDL